MFKVTRSPRTRPREDQAHHGRGLARCTHKPMAGLLGAITTLCAVVGPALAQDDFGSMVAVSGETVIVGKPGAARGPATLYRYERSATGAWELAGAMSVPGTAAAGQRWSPSLEWPDGRLVVGAGDPDVRFGAHLFRDAGSGSWSHETSLELLDMPTSEESTDREAPAGPGAAAVDFAGIMRILQPALRAVAAQGDRVAVAVGRNGMSPPVVHIFTRHAERGWEPPTVIRFPDPTDDIGTVVLDGDDLFVSSERADGAGAVHVLAHDGDQWGRRAPLYPDSTDSSAGFGAAIARGRGPAPGRRARIGPEYGGGVCVPAGNGWGVGEGPDPSSSGSRAHGAHTGPGGCRLRRARHPGPSRRAPALRQLGRDPGRRTLGRRTRGLFRCGTGPPLRAARWWLAAGPRPWRAWPAREQRSGPPWRSGRRWRWWAPQGRTGARVRPTSSPGSRAASGMRPEHRFVPAMASRPSPTVKCAVPTARPRGSSVTAWTSSRFCPLPPWAAHPASASAMSGAGPTPPRAGSMRS